MVKRVGVLALQGDVASHRRALETLGTQVLEVKKPAELEAVDALVMPGGESSALLRLFSKEMTNLLIARAQAGMPVLATCAGLILLAKKVTNPEQQSFGLLDIEVERNGYGRQLDSFVSSRLEYTEAGREAFPEQLAFEGVFIRAPRIKAYGADVEVLLLHNGEPVLVRSGSMLGATFHPELSESAICIHKYLLRL